MKHVKCIGKTFPSFHASFFVILTGPILKIPPTYLTINEMYRFTIVISKEDCLGSNISVNVFSLKPELAFEVRLVFYIWWYSQINLLIQQVRYLI